MSKRIKLAFVAVGVTALLAGGVSPALACENPRGQINGWEYCNDCCKNPRGQINGWVYCDSGCCKVPRGQINGWVPCSNSNSL